MTQIVGAGLRPRLLVTTDRQVADHQLAAASTALVRRHDPSKRLEALAAERGLGWDAVHRFGVDYAETLRQWRARYDAAVAQGRVAGFDASFHDLWRYYLMYCEGGFRGGAIDVAQVTLTRA